MFSNLMNKVIGSMRKKMKIKWDSIWFQRSVILGVAIVIASGIFSGYIDYQNQVNEYMKSNHNEIERMKEDYRRKLAKSNHFLFAKDNASDINQDR